MEITIVFLKGEACLIAMPNSTKISHGRQTMAESASRRKTWTSIGHDEPRRSRSRVFTATTLTKKSVLVSPSLLILVWASANCSGVGSCRGTLKVVLRTANDGLVTAGRLLEAAMTVLPS